MLPLSLYIAVWGHIYQQLRTYNIMLEPHRIAVSGHIYSRVQYSSIGMPACLYLMTCDASKLQIQETDAQETEARWSLTQSVTTPPQTERAPSLISYQTDAQETEFYLSLSLSLSRSVCVSLSLALSLSINLSRALSLARARSLSRSRSLSGLSIISYRQSPRVFWLTRGSDGEHTIPWTYEIRLD